MTYMLEQLKDQIDKAAPIVSFEFFPPKNEDGAEKLKKAIHALSTFSPEYVSVTYGAGGSTKEQTREIINYINTETNLTAAPHLTCVGALKEETDAIATECLSSGVTHIVALRGDMPGMEGTYTPLAGGYAYADELVSGLRNIGNFTIHVAAYPEVHPQATSEQADLDHLKRKADAGADFAITQYCFDTDVMLRFIEKARAQGITLPIVPGIMPIDNFTQIANFSARCGASIPKWLTTAFEQYESYPNTQEAQNAMAVYIATEQCRLLMQEGIDHFHFYTLNQAPIITSVCDLLGVKRNHD